MSLPSPLSHQLTPSLYSNSESAFIGMLKSLLVWTFSRAPHCLHSCTGPFGIIEAAALKGASSSTSWLEVEDAGLILKGDSHERFANNLVMRMSPDSTQDRPRGSLLPDIGRRGRSVLVILRYIPLDGLECWIDQTALYFRRFVCSISTVISRRVLARAGTEIRSGACSWKSATTGQPASAPHRQNRCVVHAARVVGASPIGKFLSTRGK